LENIKNIPDQELKRRLRILLLGLIQSAPAYFDSDDDIDRWYAWHCQCDDLLGVISPLDPAWQEASLEATDVYLDGGNLKPATLKFVEHLANAVRLLDDPTTKIDRTLVQVSFSHKQIKYLGTLKETDIPGLFDDGQESQPPA
jgi:hypothetical protein